MATLCRRRVVIVAEFSTHLEFCRAKRRLAHTPLELNAEAYIQHLICHGYARETRAAYISAVAHFSSWLAREHVAVASLDESVTRRFTHRHLPHCRCVGPLRRDYCHSSAALGHLLRHLRASGQIAPRQGLHAAVDRELEAFERYLVQVRGLAAATQRIRLNHIRAFLLDRFDTGAVKVCSLGCQDIERFITRYTQRWSPQSRKQVCSSLRIFLRFKMLEGESTSSLLAAVPKIAAWRMARLPQVVTAEQIERLFASYDRSSALGRRNFAVAHCLVDLGLRAREVPRLTLDDIDWRNGTIRIHGKARRADLLPLPSVLGRAIAQYLRHGRPATASRALFVRHHAPLDAPLTAETVRGSIRCAAARCGVLELIHGPHRLRHTAAQRLLEGGATLKTVADFLRHRSLDTTTIYTKIDRRSLAELALPWPGKPA